jgi:hypothetical protein
MLTETPTLANLPTDPLATPRARHLSRIVEMLSAAPGVRSELVDELHRQVEGGGYMSEEKLDLAIGRMLKDILA